MVYLLFGVINLINTTLSNQYSRQENSVSCSIGLAPKQLAQMTVWEGMGYVVSSILLMLAIDFQLRFWYGENSVSLLMPDESFLMNFQCCRWEHMAVIVAVELILSIWTIRTEKNNP